MNNDYLDEIANMDYRRLTYWMEIQGVDWINVVVISMTLKCEVFTDLGIIQVMNTNPPLDGSDLELTEFYHYH